MTDDRTPKQKVARAFHKVYVVLGFGAIIVGGLVGYFVGTHTTTALQARNIDRGKCITDVRAHLDSANATLRLAEGDLYKAASQLELQVVEALGALAVVDKNDPRTQEDFKAAVVRALGVSAEVPRRQAEVDRLKPALTRALDATNRLNQICPPVH